VSLTLTLPLQSCLTARLPRCCSPNDPTRASVNKKLERKKLSLYLNHGTARITGRQVELRPGRHLDLNIDGGGTRLDDRNRLRVDVIGDPEHVLFLVGVLKSHVPVTRETR
jgi:hypothetical protein